MVERANTSVTIRKLAAIRFVVIDELLQRSGRDRRIYSDREGRHRNVRNRLKVSYRIVKRPGFEDCFGDVSARPTQQDGVAVRLRMGDSGCSKRTAPTALILNNDGSEQRLNFLRPGAAYCVKSTARRKRNDQSDGPGWIGALRERKSRRKPTTYGGHQAERHQVTSPHRVLLRGTPDIPRGCHALIRISARPAATGRNASGACLLRRPFGIGRVFAGSERHAR